MIMKTSCAHDYDVDSMCRRCGKPESVEKVVLGHMPFIKSIVRGLTQGRVNIDEYEDMVMVGVVHFIYLIDRYKGGMGAKLSSYSYLGVRGEIIKYYRNNKFGYLQFRKKIKVPQPNLLSFSTIVNRDKGELTHEGSLCDTREEGVGDSLMAREELEQLKTALKCLTDKEREAYNYLYVKGYTQKKTRIILGVTPSCIYERNIHMIEKLKDRVKYGRKKVRVKRNTRLCVKCEGRFNINKVVRYQFSKRSICIKCNDRYYKRGRKWLKRETQNQD